MLWNNYRYKMAEDDTVHILQYQGEELTVKIPEQIDGCPVTEIGREAFLEYGMAIETIEVPGSVKVIREGAFRMCLSLRELVLHEGLELIEGGSFAVSPLEKLTIPSTVKMIENAYELGEMPWEISEKNPWYFSDGYGLYHRADNVQELVLVQKNDARTDYEILDGTTEIGKECFSGHAFIEKVSCPESLHCIGEDAFESCQSLKELHLNQGLEEIREDAFSYCIALKELFLPASLTEIGEKALTNTYGWSDSVSGISKIVADQRNPVYRTDENSLFQKSAYKSEYVNVYDEEAAACDSMGATYNKSVPGRNISEVPLDNVTDTNDNNPCEGEILIKYFGDKISYEIPETVTQIGWCAFRRAGIHTLILKESVQCVEEKAVMECRRLEWILLPDEGGILYVPQAPVYRKDEVGALLGDREKLQGYLFDYAGYDALFDTYFFLADKAGMACCRLKSPVLLSEQMRQTYDGYIREHLEEILLDIGQREDLERLSDLAELGYFTEDNMDFCVDVIGRVQNAKLTGYLLTWQQEHFGTLEFDFSL